MEVYIVFSGSYYEGGGIVKVCSTLEVARSYAEDLAATYEFIKFKEDHWTYKGEEKTDYIAVIKYEVVEVPLESTSGTQTPSE